MAENICVCLNGRPTCETVLIDNSDGTYNVQLGLLDAAGDPITEGHFFLSLKDSNGDNIFTNRYDIGDDINRPTETNYPGGLDQWYIDNAAYLTGTATAGDSVFFDQNNWLAQNPGFSDLKMCIRVVHPRCGENIAGEQEVCFSSSTGGDVTAPSVPLNLIPTACDDNSISIQFDNSTDDVQVDYYNVYLDGVLFTQVFEPSNTTTITGLNPGQSYDISVSAVDTSGNESAQSPVINKTTTGGVIFTNPIARIFDQGGDFINGPLQMSVDLRESDDATPLQNGDTVEFKIYDATSITLLEVLTGVVGDDISNFSSSSLDASLNTSFTSYMSGTITDGGFINFNKPSWATDNNRTYSDGSFNGSSWDSAATIVQLIICATSSNSGLQNVNPDNDASFMRAVNQIEANIFGDINTAAIGLDLYNVYDGGQEEFKYNETTLFEVRENGTLISNGVIPNDFNNTWGDYQQTFVSGALNTGSEYTFNADFDNQMSAESNMCIDSANSSLGTYFVNNRKLGNGEIYDTMQPFSEDNLPSIAFQDFILRGAHFIDTANSEMPDVDVYVDGVLLNNTFVQSDGNVEWESVPLDTIGVRKRVRFETVNLVSSPSQKYFEFDVELNYIW